MTTPLVSVKAGGIYALVGLGFLLLLIMNAYTLWQMATQSHDTTESVRQSCLREHDNRRAEHEDIKHLLGKK